jgi:predicted lipid-binding transport protein (Tim44 family)
MSMSLEAALGALRSELAGLQDVMSALHVTVMEDRPARGAVILVDRLDNVVTELSSALEEADARAAQALQIDQPHGPLENVRAILRQIQELLNRFTAKYVGELASHHAIEQLLQMGRERGREWRAWSQEVKTAVERCQIPLGTVASAMADCWSELADRLARNSVSVQATNIGQQITVRDETLEIAGRAS